MKMFVLLHKQRASLCFFTSQIQHLKGLVLSSYKRYHSLFHLPLPGGAQRSLSCQCNWVPVANTYTTPIPTYSQDIFPLLAVDLLPANDMIGDVGKINELALGMEVQGMRSLEILNGDHGIFRNRSVDIHSTDNTRTISHIHKEELTIEPWKGRGSFIML